MGWTDDEIDDLARNASANQKVEYDNAYWKEMEALLDAEKPVKKRLGWWFFGAVIVLITIGTVLYYVIGQPVERNTVLAYDSITVVQKNEQTDTSLHKKNNSYESERNNHVNKQFVPVNTEKIKTVEHKRVPSSSLTKSGLTSLKSGNVTATVVFEDSDDREKTAKDDKPEDEFESAAFALVQDITSDFESGGSFQTDVQDANEQTTEMIQVALQENSTVKNMTEDPLLQKKTGFYMAAGAGAGTSYIKTSNELMVQWRVNMGVDYTIANSFRLGAGIGFRQQIVSNLTVERSREYYSFGLIDISQSINYDRLQFVDWNIHGHYLLGKMAVGIEITPSYLISVRAHMKQIQTEYDNSVVDEVITTKLEKQFVRSNNFNSFGLDAGISFQYQFKYRMSLQALATARLNKMLMNNDFRGEYNRFPVKLELGLIKRF